MNLKEELKETEAVYDEDIKAARKRKIKMILR